MEGFWANIGFFAFLFVIVLGYERVLQYRENSCPYHPNKNVYEAAELFSHNAEVKAVIAALMRCPDIDEAAADSIVEGADPHKPDQRERYRAFIRSVNREIGEAIYATHHRP
ncbi:MAG: hypothetical protein ABFC62_02075 [Clostridiaceae bacterium]|nr:hypothetical protein [Eubacteriales bacterium]